MPGTPQTYFSNYVGSIDGFKKFHNEVINMPRAKFTDIGLRILQVLAAYLLLIKTTVSQDGNDYKEIMSLIHEEIRKGNYPNIRDTSFEDSYFQFDDLDLQYDEPSITGRMFRHYMGLCAFWGMIHSKSKRKKIIDFEKCQDFVSIDPEQINNFTRNLGLGVDIKHNDFIQNLEEISVKDTANYHPTLAILKYMKCIKRPVSDFEISILLGRIDSVQDEKIILQRALDIGRTFLSQERNGQMQEFFHQMKWLDASGALLRYSSSQQPWFKFHTYLLFLENFSLIERNIATGNYTLTNDALELLDDIPATILDLNKLISKLNLDNPSNSDITMRDILIKTNMDTLVSFVSNPDLVKRINHYSIKHPIIAKNGKPQRNQFIAELARIREKYQCQAGTKTFERPDGRNYVEAHHIIEFAKGGPDILENLLALGPTPHVQLHRGSDRAKNDLYIHLMSCGAIKYELFKTMVIEYHALRKEHLDFLSEKRLISSSQYEELLSLI